MRVLMVTESFNPRGGGEERWTAEFWHHLVTAGHNTHVVTFNILNQSERRNFHLLKDSKTIIGRARAVSNFIANSMPMVTYDTGTGWSADVFHPQAGSRLLSMDRFHASYDAVLRARMVISPRLNLLRWQMRHVERMAAQRAVRVIAVSRGLRSTFGEKYGLSPRRVTVIPNGVATKRFSRQAIAPWRNAQRAKLGVGASLLFLMVAQNLRLKGFDIALRAFALLRGQGVDAKLAVAGGVLDRAWRGLPEQLGLSEHVLFCGNVPEIEPLYAAADVFLHPTRWDACSLATIEAMAAGLPVVTTTANGAAELITDGVDGFVLPFPCDHRRLADLMFALRDPAVRGHIGATAQISASRADVGANYRSVESVLAEVAAERQLRD